VGEINLWRPEREEPIKSDNGGKLPETSVGNKMMFLSGKKEVSPVFAVCPRRNITCVN